MTSICRRCFMKGPKPWGACLAVTFLFVLALFPPLALGQAITGDLLGTVRDASGAVVPGAKLVLTQTATGVQFSTVTDSSGNYLFAQLKPSHYRIAVSKEGFKTTTISDIDLL